MKQTATDYLYDQFLKAFIEYVEEKIDGAKFSELMIDARVKSQQMEKQQINDAYWDGVCNWDDTKNSYYWEQYYVKTFQS